MRPTLDNSIKHNYQMHYKTTSSNVPNNAVITDYSVNELIEDYNLNHNNAENYYNFETDEQIVTLEAPNHATFTIQHKMNTGNTIGDFRQRIVNEMQEFNAEDEFNEIWSNDFGNKNNMTASEFYIKLKSDETYFRSRSEDISKDLK